MVLWHSHSNSKCFEEVGFLLSGRHNDGLVGDVGERDLVLTYTALGGLFTHNEHQQLHRGRLEERERKKEGGRERERERVCVGRQMDQWECFN